MAIGQQHDLELIKDLAHTTVRAVCTCGWKGTDMKGPQRETAARMQHDSHLTSLEVTGTQHLPTRSPEAEEAQAELAAEREHVANSRTNAEAAQLAQVRYMNSQANLRNAIAWAITVAWILAVIYVLVVVL